MTSNINLLDTSHQDNIQIEEPENEVDHDVVDSEEIQPENEVDNNIADLEDIQLENEFDNDIVDLEKIQPENEIDKDILDWNHIQNKNLPPSECSNNSYEIQKECHKFCPLSVIL